MLIFNWIWANETSNYSHFLRSKVSTQHFFRVSRSRPGMSELWHMGHMCSIWIILIAHEILQNRWLIWLKTKIYKYKYSVRYIFTIYSKLIGWILIVCVNSLHVQETRKWAVIVVQCKIYLLSVLVGILNWTQHTTMTAHILVPWLCTDNRLNQLFLWQSIV
jgi:hypothetical protein